MDGYPFHSASETAEKWVLNGGLIFSAISSPDISSNWWIVDIDLVYRRVG